MDDPESTLHAKRELTSAGQNGSELSGGQQARVALARCIYASLAGSECVILDDPIKALDPATAARCWDNMKLTMAGKTRVLVVNSQMLQRFASDKAVDRLIIVENEGGDGQPGRITFNGKPTDLPAEVTDRLGDGYAVLESVMELPVEAPATEPEAELAAEPEAEPEAKPEAKAAPEKKKQEKTKAEKGTIPGAVFAYCKRMGLWLVVSAVGNVMTQVGSRRIVALHHHSAALS
jgi:ABC-type multidrug transport system ATPase subunit